MALKSVEDEDFGMEAIDVIKEEMLAQTSPELLEAWVTPAVGRSEILDRECVRVALEHLVAGNTKSAATVARVLCDSPEGTQELRRDAAVLRSLIEGPRQRETERYGGKVRWIPDRLTRPAEWREFFFDGVQTTGSGRWLEIGLCEFPRHLRDSLLEGHDGASSVVVASYLWRLGCACGLAMRGEGLLTPTELESVLQLLLGNGLRELELHMLHHNVLVDCTSTYIPLVAYSVRNNGPLREVLVRIVDSQLGDVLEDASERTYGFLEATWVLAPEKWRTIAQKNVSKRFFPWSGPHERSRWFRYWSRLCGVRGVELPEDFNGRAVVSRLGVPRKTDPAAIAVELICRAPLPDVERSRLVQRLGDLLIRLNREPEGDRAAYRQLPRVLARALSIDPLMFEAEFLRETTQYEIEEPFDSIVARVARCWLEAGVTATVEELCALWYWVAASPGSFRDDADGRGAADLIVARLSEMGAENEAEEIGAWLSALSPKPSSTAFASAATATGRDGETPDIRDVNPRWLNRWWSQSEYEYLQRYLLERGESAWRDVCVQLGDQIAAASGLFADEYRVIAEGVCGLRPDIALLPAVDVAIGHLGEKVQFQLEPVPAEAREGPGTRVDVFVRLLTRGLDFGDVETLRRTLRSTCALASTLGARTALEREMNSRLSSDDVRCNLYALIVLSRMGVLRQYTLDAVRELEEHSNAWCRWLACQILRSEPVWLAPRAVLSTVGIVAPGLAPERSEGAAVYYSGQTHVKEVYVRKLRSLFELSEDELRSILDTEIRALPDVNPRTSGWQRQRGRLVTSDRVSEAAACAASRLVSGVPSTRVPTVLSAVALSDPWLIVAPPLVPLRDGWTVWCRSETTHAADEDIHSFEWLIAVPEGLQHGSDALPPEALADLAARLLKPQDPEEFCWVAAAWTSMEAPVMQNTTLKSLAFFNSVFTELPRDRFELVPAWGLSAFRKLTFDGSSVPSWVLPGVGQVLVAGYGERFEDHGGAGHPRTSWWSGWAAEPRWLSTIVPETFRVVRCTRVERFKKPRNGKARSLGVEFAAEEVVQT